MAKNNQIKTDAWGSIVLAEVTDKMNILLARDYDRERGYWICISETMNGYQWNTGNAIDRSTAIALRDALTKLIES